MIDHTPYRTVVASNANELVLENGLARRVFRLAPNAATIDLQNLTSGEHYLRAIAPEARVKIDGVDYAVGGLKGAPIANYINASWLDELAADPGAYQFAGYSVGETLPRFAWQKRPEWLARDLPWPPPGKHLVMRYSPPVAPPRFSAGLCFWRWISPHSLTVRRWIRPGRSSNPPTLTAPPFSTKARWAR
jgi:hypothetical protein